MYQGNIYIDNHKELSAITEADGSPATIGRQFDVFDKRHGLAHNDLARAQYKHWREVETGSDKLLTPDERELLDL